MYSGNSGVLAQSLEYDSHLIRQSVTPDSGQIGEAWRIAKALKARHGLALSTILHESSERTSRSKTVVGSATECPDINLDRARRVFVSGWLRSHETIK